MVYPVGQRLLVTPLSGGEVTTQSGFILQQNTDFMMSVKCRVEYVGSGCVNLWPVGTIILAPPQSFTEAKDDPTDKTVVISEDDILAVVAPDPASV